MEGVGGRAACWPGIDRGPSQSKLTEDRKKSPPQITSETKGRSETGEASLNGLELGGRHICRLKKLQVLVHGIGIIHGFTNEFSPIFCGCK